MGRGTVWGQRDETGQKDRCTRTGIERMGHGQRDGYRATRREGQDRGRETETCFNLGAYDSLSDGR